MNNDIVLSCNQVTKQFKEGSSQLEVLRGINFSLRAGERVAIVGNSGSGKTTLLQLLGGLDIPTAGDIQLMGQSMHKLTQQQRGQLRNRYLGFVYQFHHLLPEFTALENVAMPLLIRKTSVAEARTQAEQILQKVGLAARIHHKPAELSGGERQRVAVARALVTQPACILADEPTGNLDAHNAQEVYRCLLELTQNNHSAFVIVTHDMQIAQRVDRVLTMEDGILSAV